MHGKPKGFRVAPDTSECPSSPGLTNVDVIYSGKEYENSNVSLKRNTIELKLDNNLDHNKLKKLAENNSVENPINIITNMNDRFNEKLDKYIKARQRIFSGNCLSKKVLNARNRFKDRKDLRKAIEATEFDKDNDIRPYLDVILFGNKISGLADTGSEVCALGKDAIEFLTDCNVKMTPFHGTVSTADNSRSKIVGKIKANITFRGIEKSFTILIVPSLAQSLYLGANFIEAYNLAPNLFNLEEITDNIQADLNMHSLTAFQNEQLQQVISKFPSYEKSGLGCTHLLEHSIDTGNSPPVKQRHYPYSPAVQKILAVDNMLNEGIIQHSESGWNSPIAPVFKSDKVRKLQQ